MNSKDNSANLYSRENQRCGEVKRVDGFSPAKDQHKLAYKDGLFRLLFNEREAFVELYNAVSGKAYEAESAKFIEHVEGFKSKIRHDLAYILDNKLIVMMEHQSTRNDYLPLRMLRYFIAINLKLYRGALLYRAKLAEPIASVEFYVIYNGREPLPRILKLSEIMSSPCYHEDGTPHLECAIGVIDLGRDTQVRPNVQVLEAYCFLVGKIENYIKEGKTADEAVRMAIYLAEEERLITSEQKRKLLEAEMELFEQYDEEEVRKVLREEAIEEGLEIGLEKGLEQGLEKGLEQGLEEGIGIGLNLGIRNVASKMKKSGLSEEEIILFTGLTKEELQEL